MTTLPTPPSPPPSQPVPTIYSTLGKIAVGLGVIWLAKLFPSVASQLTPTEIAAAAVPVGLTINEAVNHLVAYLAKRAAALGVMDL